MNFRNFPPSANSTEFSGWLIESKLTVKEKNTLLQPLKHVLALCKAWTQKLQETFFPGSKEITKVCCALFQRHATVLISIWQKGNCFKNKIFQNLHLSFSKGEAVYYRSQNKLKCITEKWVQSRVVYCLLWWLMSYIEANGNLQSRILYIILSPSFFSVKPTRHSALFGLEIQIPPSFQRRFSVNY